MNFNSRPVSVLLVDDDEINNFISIKLIKKALLNTEIVACLNGKFAIDQLVEMQKKGPEKLPDYILLDINMPIMNGWEFLDEYKRLNIDPLGKWFDLDGRNGWAVIFHAGGDPADYFAGWVPAERAAEADQWITFLNQEIAARLDAAPAKS